MPRVKRAQSALESQSSGMPYKLIKGEAAFYGPKIDVKLIDAIGRSWQLSTVQFDFNLPKKFELEYVAPDGSRKTPLMVHRALYGSIERFFGILVEHYAGNFPLWLSPVQVKILTLTDEQAAPAQALEASLKAAGLRVVVDLPPEKIGAKIRHAQIDTIPYMISLARKTCRGTRWPCACATAGSSTAAESEFVSRLVKESADKKTASSWEQA